MKKWSELPGGEEAAEFPDERLARRYCVVAPLGLRHANNCVVGESCQLANQVEKRIVPALEREGDADACRSVARQDRLAWPSLKKRNHAFCRFGKGDAFARDPIGRSECR